MGQLNAGDGAAGDHFGYSVAMSGDLCVIGARLDDSPTVNGGSAYVFRYDAMSLNWIQEAKLTGADTATGDEFGYSVSVFAGAEFNNGEDLIVVGARHDDDEGTDSGSAYVFHHNGTSWVQAAKLTAADGAATDRFGAAVSIAGEFVIVGALDDNAPATNSGSAYIFHENGGTWSQQAKLTSSDAASNDQFGRSVSIAIGLDGNSAVALIGSWHDDNPALDSGSAYVFRYAGSWVEEVKLFALDGVTTDEFGCAVSIRATSNGDLALVGARNDDDHGANSGSAYMFRKDGSIWTQEAKLTASDSIAGDQFGFSVALTAMGEAAVVGAWHNDQSGADSGAAYVFQRQPQSNSWPQIDKLQSSDQAAGDVYGASVAASNDRAAIGGYQVDFAGADSGAALLFAGVSGFDGNANGVADGCDVPGDADGDGTVGYPDILTVIAHWGVCPAPPTPCLGDMNVTGTVNVQDLLIVIAGGNWN